MADPTTADYARLMQQVVALRSQVENRQEPSAPSETWGPCPNKCGQSVRSDLKHLCVPKSSSAEVQLSGRVALIEMRLSSVILSGLIAARRG